MEKEMDLDVSLVLVLFLLVLLPITGFLLGRDAFSLPTPVGRVVLIDIVMIAFVASTVLLQREYRVSILGLIVGLCIVLFGITGFISVANLVLTGTGIPNLSLAIVDSIRYVVYGLCLVAISSVISNEKNYNLFLRVWIFSTIIVISAGIGQILGVLSVPPFEQYFLWENISGGGNRIAATYRRQGPLTLFFGVTLPIISALASNTVSIKKYIGYLIIIVLSVLVLLFTGSRSGLLILPLAFAPLVYSFNSKLKSVLNVSVIGIMSIGLAFVSNHPTINRLFHTMVEFITSPSDPRLDIWSAALSDYLSISVIFGFGPRQFNQYSPRFAHNTYIAGLFERGLLGLLIILALIIVMLELSRRIIILSKNIPMSAAFLCGLINLFGYSMIGESLSYRTTALYLGLVVGFYHICLIRSEHQTLVRNRLSE